MPHRLYQSRDSGIREKMDASRSRCRRHRLEYQVSSRLSVVDQTFAVFRSQKPYKTSGKSANISLVSNVAKNVSQDMTTPFSTNGNADFLLRLPQPATEHDRSGYTSFTSRDEEGICLVRACGLRTSDLPIAGIGLGGLMLRAPDETVVGVLFLPRMTMI